MTSFSFLGDLLRATCRVPSLGTDAASLSFFGLPRLGALEAAEVEGVAAPLASAAAAVDLEGVDPLGAGRRPRLVLWRRLGAEEVAEGVHVVDESLDSPFASPAAPGLLASPLSSFASSSSSPSPTPSPFPLPSPDGPALTAPSSAPADEASNIGFLCETSDVALAGGRFKGLAGTEGRDGRSDGVADGRLPEASISSSAYSWKEKVE